MRTLDTDSLEISSARWTPTGICSSSPGPPQRPRAPSRCPAQDSVAASPDSAAADSVKRANRSNWWLLSQDLSRRRNLTADLEKVPGSLRPVMDGATFLGLADSTLWMVNARTATAFPVSTPSLPKLTSIIWPSSNGSGPPFPPVVIVQAGEGADRQLYRVDLGGPTAEVRPFPQPAPGASLVVFDPERSVVVFRGNERTGTYLWLDDGGVPGSNRPSP